MINSTETSNTMEQLHKNEAWLMKKYWDEKLSVDQIAIKYGYERSSIFRSMRKLEIPRRSIREARLLVCRNKPYRKRSWLYKQYRKKKLSADRIAEKCSTDSGTIISWLDKLEIQRRNSSEVAKLRRKNRLKTLYGSRLNRILLIGGDLVKSFKRYF